MPNILPVSGIGTIPQGPQGCLVLFFAVKDRLAWVNPETKARLKSYPGIFGLPHSGHRVSLFRPSQADRHDKDADCARPPGRFQS
ncbi:MAG: hypothetical protein JEZ02_21345 [Desulfatibacillum sp.]|nr:hypothetical protein [Desulfatibacillum sp.]